MTSPADEKTKSSTETTRNPDREDLIGNISSHAIFKLDAEARIESWSDSAQSIYGYEATAINHHHVSDLFADREGPNSDLEAVLAEAQSGAVEIEHWNKRVDDSVFWATMTLSPLDDGDFDGYVVIIQDTTARKQYEQMLERQNDRLKEFTDILAHDLRSPLSLIEGRLELYRETGDDEHVEQIEETTDRMERLVDDLLRVAKQGEVVTNPESIDLKRVIDIAWEGTGNTTGEATLEYEEAPSIGGDYDRLCELFENLFRNSIDHAGPDVTVRVGPITDGFYVEDDGPGIDAENLDYVFDHGFTTSDTGSGYGLSVARTIVNAHGWDIEATASESDGARFEITGIEFLT